MVGGGGGGVFFKLFNSDGSGKQLLGITKRP